MTRGNSTSKHATLGQVSLAGGFTLVEMMIVVAIISVLAVVAGGAYTKYLNNARKSEVHSMFAEIRVKEEAYRAEFSTYASSGTGETDVWPALLGAGQGEPKAKSWASGIAGNWNNLGIAPGRSMLYCGYSIVAGLSNVAAAGTLGAAIWASAPTTPWWYAVGVCDNDGKGPPNATFVTSFDKDTIYEQNVGN